MLDPAPRVILVPGFGLFGLGRSKKDAKVAADLACAAVDAITAAEAIGRFSPIGEEDMFDCEYWSLEQAKLGAAKELPLAGQIAVITGAAGAIGLATAKAFAAAGAEVALLDLDGKAAQDKAKAIGGTAIGLSCDVTDDASVRCSLRQGRGNLRRRRYRGVECRRCLAGPHRRGRRCDVAKKLRTEFLLASARRAAMPCGSCWRRAAADACSSTHRNRRSIPDRISGPTACRRRRPCSSPANMRSITAPTASAPMR